MEQWVIKEFIKKNKMVKNEIGGNTTTIKNIGGKKQRLEAPVKTIILAKESQFFTPEDFKNVAEKWKAGIKDKSLAPFPNAEGLEPNSSEANIKEGRYEDYELKKAVSGTKYRFDISNTTYEAFLTYKNSEYTRVYEITDLEEVLCDIDDNGNIRGRKLSSFLIGNRNQATDGDVPYVDVSIKYENNTNSILKTDGEPSYLEGIFDVEFEKIETTGTSVKFKVKNISTGSYINQISYDSFKLIDSSGAVVGGLGNIPVSSDYIYEITGTIPSGSKLSLDGVVDLTELFIEGRNEIQID